MPEHLSAYLRGLRRRRGESQRTLAERLGVSQQRISKLERGECGLDGIVDLCRALGVPLSLRIGRRTVTLVHPLHPDERKEIELNIDWFSRLKPADRLRANALNVRASDRLVEAARRGR